MSSPARDVADELVIRLLAADPFSGTGLGLREYDALVPDPSAEADAVLDRDLADIAGRAGQAEVSSGAERVTRDAVLATCERQRLSIAARSGEFTVTAMPYSGPPALYALAARTVLVDGQAAADYVQRLRGCGDWIDGQTQRLREGRASGRRPVASLVGQAVDWADRMLGEPVPAAFTSAAAPDGWDGADAWRDERDAAVRDVVQPALGRWRDLVAELRADARPDDAAGLWALPDGEAEYQRAIEVHTTLGHTADELHEIGRAEIARLEDRARELGATLGLADLSAVVAAVRASSDELSAADALQAARDAVRRAEARASEIMPAPLPSPCAVEPMPVTVADAGAAPHYTRPRRDGSRPGTYWFNTRRATAGTGWDLEAVAFHETVPGHHSQLARSALLADLPLLQHLTVTVHAEGWGLYAERLAGEFVLFSDVRAEIGAVYVEMHRAARLVVDTGLHSLRWSRQQAADYLLEHVALPTTFLTDEIDRYIAWPGQALAYMSGLREILRLREQAQTQLGSRFDLPSFNGAIVDCGSVAMPVLATVVDNWVESR